MTTPNPSGDGHNSTRISGRPVWAYAAAAACFAVGFGLYALITSLWFPDGVGRYATMLLTFLAASGGAGIALRRLGGTGPDGD